MNKSFISFVVNNVLLLAGVVMAFSGMLLQIKYHLGSHGGIDIYRTSLGLNYFAWSNIHVAAILLVSIIMAFHISLHWKWYKAVIKKNLIAKNRPTIILSILFIIVAITGFIPLLIKLTGGEYAIRKGIIEIHDKFAIILFLFLVGHIIKRIKWFKSTFEKLTK